MSNCQRVYVIFGRGMICHPAASVTSARRGSPGCRAAEHSTAWRKPPPMAGESKNHLEECWFGGVVVIVVFTHNQSFRVSQVTIAVSILKRWTKHGWLGSTPVSDTSLCFILRVKDYEKGCIFRGIGKKMFPSGNEGSFCRFLMWIAISKLLLIISLLLMSWPYYCCRIEFINVHHYHFFRCLQGIQVSKKKV